MVVEFIKCIENNLFREVDSISSAVRSQSVPIIKRIFKRTNNMNVNEKFLRCLQITKELTKDNTDILFTKADKGNATVAIDIDDYNNKMKEMFSDSDTYITVGRDPLKKLVDSVRNLLMGWLKKEYIDIRIDRKLLITDGSATRGDRLRAAKTTQSWLPP